MSLSFPLLISAVPLYAIDYERARAAERAPEVCWFSDGGISSNFPVHFFDSPLPSRPTFAVNLRYLAANPEAGAEVVMAKNNIGGIAEWFKRFRPGIGGFLGALRDMGYDGPVTTEPFKRELQDLPSDAARLVVVKASMDAVWKWAGWR